MAKTPKDLHLKKASHLTVAVRKGIEIHLQKQDFGNIKHKTGQKVDIKVPMVTTSVDKGHARFKQTGKLKPELPNDKVKRISKRMFGAKEKH